MSVRSTGGEPERWPVEDRPHASILGGSLAVGGSTALRLAASFAIAIMVARLLGAEAKGQLTLLQQVPAIAALVLGLGFDAAHAYHVGRHRRDPSEAVSDSLAYVLVASSFGVPLSALVMWLWFPALGETPAATITAAALAVPLLMMTSLLGGILTGMGRLPSQAAAQAVAALASVALITVLALFDALSLELVIASALLAHTVAALGALAATRIRALPRPSLARLRSELPYARRSYVQSVTGYLEMRQDVILLGILGSAAGVGIYSVGVSLAELLLYAPQTIGAALSARALQEGAQSGALITARTTRLVTALMAVAAVGLVLVARPLVLALFGDQFAAASMVIVVLTPGIVIWGISAQPGAYLASHGRLFPRMSTATLLMNFVLNLALIPELGAVGAAIATALSYSVVSAYIIWTFTRATGIRLRDLVVVRVEDVRFALAAARALRHPQA